MAGHINMVFHGGYFSTSYKSVGSHPPVKTKQYVECGIPVISHK